MSKSGTGADEKQSASHVAVFGSNRSGGRQGKLGAAQLMSRTVGGATGGGPQARVEGKVKIAVAKSPKVVLKQ